MKLLLLSLILIIASQLPASSETLRVRVLTGIPVKSSLVTPYSGIYKVYADSSHLISIGKNEVLLVSFEKDSMELSFLNKKLGRFKHVTIQPQDQISSLTIKSIQPEKTAVIYDDGMSLNIENDHIRFINVVEIENYIAGVIESEVGTKAKLEYYKLQSIICRTYALSSLRRHEGEGYHLCNRVHCQAYKYKSRGSDDIIKAVIATKGLVIVDQNLDLITASFHSNCGGQTANSQDVWSLPKPYLVSIKDSFCTSQPHAKWEKQIPKSHWVEYMNKHNPRLEQSDIWASKSFTQPKREIYFKLHDVNIPLKTMRTDLGLNSTLFNIEHTDESVILRGKGYGHGVGMCQEGAMHMAELGYGFKDILNFYYKGVNLVPLSDLIFFKE